MQRLILNLFMFASIFAFIGNNMAISQEKQYSLDDVFEQSEEVRRRQKSCGPLSLARTLYLLDSQVPYDKLRAHFKSFNGEGVQLQELLDVAQTYWPDAEAVKYETDTVEKLPFPLIGVVGNGQHCIVFEGIDEEGLVRVWDPAVLENETLTPRQLQHVWTGEAFIFSKPPTTVDKALEVVLRLLCLVNLSLGILLVRKMTRQVPQPA